MRYFNTINKTMLSIYENNKYTTMLLNQDVVNKILKYKKKSMPFYFLFHLISRGLTIIFLLFASKKIKITDYY